MESYIYNYIYNNNIISDSYQIHPVWDHQLGYNYASSKSTPISEPGCTHLWVLTCHQKNTQLSLNTWRWSNNRTPTQISGDSALDFSWVTVNHPCLIDLFVSLRKKHVKTKRWWFNHHLLVPFSFFFPICCSPHATPVASDWQGSIFLLCLGRLGTKDALRPGRMASGKEMWEYHGISPFPGGFSIATLDCQRVVICYNPG